ncbi:centromere protein H [Peromyscus californicus insignis]|uniref:centromere protein H n=1 Tax=Peromyscus californicus insignis TaxID=564181 RepID=UPI0022A71E5B|nr:centromere protein H [Peromyscus californicus insignis]
MASAMEPPGAAAGVEDCGAVRGVPQAAEDNVEDRIRLLLRLRAQTKQQLLEYKSMIDANEEKTPEQIMQEKQMEFKIEDLENEIEDVKSNFEMKNLALNRMKLSAALKNNMEKVGVESSVLADDLKHILKLQKLIMKSQEESSELEAKLLDVRKKRLQLKQTSRSKLLEIQTEKSKQKEDLDSMENSEIIKTMQKKLQTEIKITTVIQHVFQGLILGSKINWAEDPALREIVLQLEKNLTTI